ncbi:hypothetical protein NDU88_006484 [Pleurodeles waltl]|uniref:Uncharacterized protein n=1 Tax=Pleurodeles waltl TaxID=8319 RepID=A0AAV7PRH1_PLEWA|nr:hypothetical protein NDU88_006484 [Pleurodeles waltl]
MPLCLLSPCIVDGRAGEELLACGTEKTGAVIPRLRLSGVLPGCWAASHCFLFLVGLSWVELRLWFMACGLWIGTRKSVGSYVQAELHCLPLLLPDTEHYYAPLLALPRSALWLHCHGCRPVQSGAVARGLAGVVRDLARLGCARLELGQALQELHGVVGGHGQKMAFWSFLEPSVTPPPRHPLPMALAELGQVGWDGSELLNFEVEL